MILTFQCNASFYYIRIHIMSVAGSFKHYELLIRLSPFDTFSFVTCLEDKLSRIKSPKLQQLLQALQSDHIRL